MLSINDTVTEMVQWVFPEHAGAPGQIHGGRMMQWIATVGNMAAARVARGHCLLGAMDDIDFLHPVKVDEHLKPTPVPTTLAPSGAAEEAQFAAARERREHRLERLARSASAAADVRDDEEEELRWAFESSRSVLPEDTIFGNTMFPGKLLMDIDEAGGILSMRYVRGHVMTACLDALDFYSPISTHEVVTFKAALNQVGHSSLEAGVKVLTEVPWSGEVRHACTAYLTFVHLGPDMRPRPCPPFVPETPCEKRRWAQAEERRARRRERVKRLKASIQEGR